MAVDFRLAVALLSGSLAVAIVFFMSSVTFLDIHKRLFIDFIPFGADAPVNRTVHRKVYYPSEVGDNGTYPPLQRLVNDSTTPVPAADQLDVKRPNDEAETPVLSVLYADNEVGITDEGLSDINAQQHPLDSALADYVATAPAQLLSLTLLRLRFRVSQRLSRAGAYQAATDRLLAGNRSAPLLACNFEAQGGLGNWLFMIASAFGLARTTHRVPVVLHDYSWAHRHFTNFSLPRINRSTFIGTDDEQAWKEAILHETSAGKYRPELTNITTEKNVVVDGYLQSWKYFDAYRDDIRSLFTFTEDVFTRSLNSIEAALTSYFNSSRESELPALVGIHVRRGDITSSDQVKHGHRAASEEYLLRAVLRFQQEYEPVAFVVISNELDYCRQLFAGFGNLLFVETGDVGVDMATLSLMDHLILSVGSYGWWAAYLSDAKEVMYFKNWPRNGSDMYRLFTAEDYFLPSWTPYS